MRPAICGGPPVEVTLIDRRNFHLFQPLLYQVATGRVVAGEHCGAAAERARAADELRSADGRGDGLRRRGAPRDPRRHDAVPYDTLIVAAGARHSYFGHPEWERIRARPEDDRRRDGNSPPAAHRVRAGGARSRIIERRPDAAHVRDRRRRADGRRAGRGDGRDRAVRARSTSFATSIRPTRRSCSSKRATACWRRFRPSSRQRPRQSLEKLGVTVRTKTMVTAIAARSRDARVRRRRRTAADADGDLGGGRRGVAAGKELWPRRPVRRSIARGGSRWRPICRSRAIRRSSCWATWRATRTKAASRCPASRRWRFSRAGSWRS